MNRLIINTVRIMGKNFKNRGNHKNQNHHFSNKKDHKKTPKNTNWQTEKRLLETDVAITEFISEYKGFHGIIKSRYNY